MCFILTFVVVVVLDVYVFPFSTLQKGDGSFVTLSHKSLILTDGELAKTYCNTNLIKSSRVLTNVNILNKNWSLSQKGSDPCLNFCFSQTFNSFNLSFYDSNSFKIFCVEVFINLKSFKITREITSDVLKIPLTSNQKMSTRIFLWMDGCAKLRIVALYFIFVVRTFNPINVTISLYLFKMSNMSPARKHRPKSHFARVSNRLLSKLFCLSFLLLVSGDIHSNPGPIFRGLQRHPSKQGLVVGAWNVRTLLEKKRSHVRPTAIVGRTLKAYNIDICALSETRLSGENIISEQGAGYTFFLKGRSENLTPQLHGVGFAIRTKLIECLNDKVPIGINERLMTMSLPIQRGNLHIISAYAPTLSQSDEVKEQFYDQLNKTLDKIPPTDKLLLLGDFNARVGTDSEGWEGVIGKHGVGGENSNGTSLLSLCSQREFVITNTMFQQAKHCKTSWMHPGTKEWHLIDYAITRQRDVKDVLHTKAMCGSSNWSDHKLVKCALAFQSKKPLRHKAKISTRKLNINKLASPETRYKLANNLSEAFSNTAISDDTSDNTWANLCKITRQVSENVLGFSYRKHRDWFDENDQFIQPLLKELHDLKCQLLLDKNNSVLNDTFHEKKKTVQSRLHDMQNSWWIARAEEIQTAADKRDYKSFWQGLKAIYGPKYQSYPSIKSKDGETLITDPKGILNRWVEHFDSVLNQPSTFDMGVLDKLPHWNVNPDLAIPPSLKEVEDSIKQLSSGKAAGADGIPPDVFKHGGPAMAEQLHKLFTQSWNEGKVPQAFKDADLIHLYKNKGDIKCCDNHRGISLLCIAGKIYARLFLNRLVKHIKAIRLIPESQCGFEAGRSTIDPCFALRQLQEMCWLHSRDLYLLFVDLTKAFDTVNRDGLWALLKRIGCPDHFISMIKSFHDGMKITVREGNDKAEPFAVMNGTKQGCVLAPTLFSIFFSLMLYVAFENMEEGVKIQSRFDRGLLNTSNQHYKAPTKIEYSVIRDLLFADDCALAASSEEDLQTLCDSLADAARRFGLKISIDKTESMYQAPPRAVYQKPEIMVEGNKLKAVKNFKYLGSIVSDDHSMNAEIDARLVRANAAYNKLTKRLWRKSGIRLTTKIAVYKAAVLSSLLYGSEAWTLPRRLVRKLEKFHLNCLRKIAAIKWFHKVPNYRVLEKCQIMSITSILDQNKLRWVGHVMRMGEDRIPKRMLYGRLACGSSKQGNHLTYFNSVRKALRSCNLYCPNLEENTSKRTEWRRKIKSGVLKADEDYRNGLKVKYMQSSMLRHTN